MASHRPISAAVVIRGYCHLKSARPALELMKYRSKRELAFFGRRQSCFGYGLRPPNVLPSLSPFFSSALRQIYDPNFDIQKQWPSLQMRAQKNFFSVYLLLA